MQSVFGQDLIHHILHLCHSEGGCTKFASGRILSLNTCAWHSNAILSTYIPVERLMRCSFIINSILEYSPNIAPIDSSRLNVHRFLRFCLTVAHIRTVCEETVSQVSHKAPDPELRTYSKFPRTHEVRKQYPTGLLIQGQI